MPSVNFKKINSNESFKFRALLFLLLSLCRFASSFVCGTLGGWWKASSSKLSKNDVIDECSEAATALLVLSVSEFCCTLPSPSFQKKQICLTLWPLYCSVTLKEADAQPHNISVEAKEKRRVTKTKKSRENDAALVGRRI